MSDAESVPSGPHWLLWRAFWSVEDTCSSPESLLGGFDCGCSGLCLRCAESAAYRRGAAPKQRTLIEFRGGEPMDEKNSNEQPIDTDWLEVLIADDTQPMLSNRSWTLDKPRITQPDDNGLERSRKY